MARGGVDLVKILPKMSELKIEERWRGGVPAQSHYRGELRRARQKKTVT